LSWNIIKKYDVRNETSDGNNHKTRSDNITDEQKKQEIGEVAQLLEYAFGWWRGVVDNAFRLKRS